MIHLYFYWISSWSSLLSVKWKDEFCAVAWKNTITLEHCQSLAAFYLETLWPNRNLSLFCSIGWCHQGVRVSDCHDLHSIFSLIFFFFFRDSYWEIESTCATFGLDVLTHHLLFVLDPFSKIWHAPTTHAFLFAYSMYYAVDIESIVYMYIEFTSLRPWLCHAFNSLERNLKPTFTPSCKIHWHFTLSPFFIMATIKASYIN